MKRIVIELSEAGCERAAIELETYARSLDRKLAEVCRRLAEVGAAEAKAIAYGASVQGLGNDDVTITTEPMSNGYKIVMSGEDIYFIEFGTGIFAGEYPGDTSNVTVGIMPGDWSDTHAQLFSNYGYWFYNKQKLEGTPAYMPMYYAGRKMREEMPRIAREVFSEK